MQRPIVSFIVVGFISLVGPAAALAQSDEFRSHGRIEVLDPAMDSFVSPDSQIEILASGFTWTEGPLWVPATAKVEGCGGTDGFLLFSDIPRNTIFRWTPGTANRPGQGIDVFLNPSGYTGAAYYGLEPGSNGLILNGDGELCMCEHGDRRVSILTPGGGKRTLVDAYQGKRLNSPNDLAFDATGNLYFTDPPYGLPDREKDPMRQLDHFGVYRLSTAGEVTLLTAEMTRPNGIALSPNQDTLYVAQSDPQNPIWVAFKIQPNGTLGSKRVLNNAAEFMKEFPGLPDGMTVHSSGTLFCSGPGGVYVMTPGGKLIGRIVTGGRTSNCTFDDDESNLYITNDANLCRVRMKSNAN